MTNRKKVREKGKIKFSEYFKNLKNGDTVAIVTEKSLPSYYPKRMIGNSGKIIGQRGRSKIVEINSGKSTKLFVVHPIHLKKLK